MIISLIVLIIAYNQYKKAVTRDPFKNPTKGYIGLAWLLFCVQLLVIGLSHKFKPTEVMFPIFSYIYHMLKPQRKVLLQGVYTGKSNNISTGGGAV